MPLLSDDLEAYLCEMSSPEPDRLRRLQRETHLKVLYPRMLSGQVQGRFLALLVHMIRPQHILEVGTYTGYSALCMAEGLPPTGRITTLELDPERGWLIRKYLAEAGLTDRVTVIFGRAMDTLPQQTGPFDLAFIDADKANYAAYYELILPRMVTGGIILADNVLWDGKVLDLNSQDKETKGIRDFNQLVRDDPRVEQVMLPLRDGMTLIRKK
jgi:predicted O-methyltransferase YrrM